MLNNLPPSATFAVTTNDFQSRSSLNRIQMNMTGEEFRALKRLRKDESIIIWKADKGRSLVVLDKNAYIESEISLLQGNKFKPINKDPTINREKLYNQELKELLTTKAIDETVQSMLIQSSFTDRQYREKVNKCLLIDTFSQTMPQLIFSRRLMRFAMNEARSRIQIIRRRLLLLWYDTSWVDFVDILSTHSFVNNTIKSLTMDITIKRDKNISNPTIQHVTAIIPNNSQRPLSDVEVTVLNGGPDFIPTARIHLIEIRCDSKVMLNNLPPSATFDVTTNDFQFRSIKRITDYKGN
ncbi:hypothetical protein GJ496_007926 [Pomphorhynchus laevis]|nr:hypothetical protein GJ496_007926 [Pomphorhynchus laevis]